MMASIGAVTWPDVLRHRLYIRSSCFYSFQAACFLKLAPMQPYKLEIGRLVGRIEGIEIHQTDGPQGRANSRVEQPLVAGFAVHGRAEQYQA